MLNLRGRGGNLVQTKVRACTLRCPAHWQAQVPHVRKFWAGGPAGSSSKTSAFAAPDLRLRAVAEADRVGETQPLAADSANTEWPGGFHDCYEVLRVLGQGSFGTVRLVKDRLTGKEYAAKEIAKRRDGAATHHILRRIRTEVEVLESLQSCPEAIRLQGVYQDERHVHVVTEACFGGDLEQFLRRQGVLTEGEAAKVLHDVLKVLAECHRQGVCYADVKPANFLLRHVYPDARSLVDGSASHARLDVRVVDFGCSQRITKGNRLFKTTGTPLYMAPESFMRYYGVESDMWAVGMMLYQMLSGRLPFWRAGESRSPLSVMSAILSDTVAFEGAPWDTMSAGAIDLLRGLLDRDYNTRLTASAALRHPWIAQHCDEHDGCVVSSNVVELGHLHARLRGRPAALPLS